MFAFSVPFAMIGEWLSRRRPDYMNAPTNRWTRIARVKPSQDMNWDDLERQFISEGFGNGSLHPHVVHDPITYWETGRREDDFYVGFNFHWNDWQALFWTALNAAKRDDYVQGEDINEFHEHNRRKFEDSIADYPLLGRMFDMYEDAAYEAAEIEPLRNECVNVRDNTNHKDVIRAANKIILACNKAAERGLGMRLISD